MSEDPATKEPDSKTSKPRVTAVPFRPEQVPAPSVRLEEDNRHPVLIFGSSQSGKSTLIMSLINALEKSGADGGVGVSHSFGHSFYAKRDARVELQRSYALEFYETGSHNWILGSQSLKTTQVDVPYFVPVDLTIKGRENDVVKIALLDGRGEWYEPLRTPISSMYQELQQDIIEILKNYSHGLSVVCVAPYSLSHDNLHDTIDSDAGLLAALLKYEEARAPQDRQSDSFLFLLSKWDQVASPQRDKRFTTLFGNDVISEIEVRYKRAWDRFRNMPIGNDDWARRCFMQYSSCSFVDGKPRIQPHLVESYIRYPRTILNWIFGNARRFEDRLGESVNTAELVLFPDVMPPDTYYIPVSERFIRILTR